MLKSNESKITTEIINLISSEIKKYKRQDIILSEREIAENEKIAKILEELFLKIKNLTYESKYESKYER